MVFWEGPKAVLLDMARAGFRRDLLPVRLFPGLKTTISGLKKRILGTLAMNNQELIVTRPRKNPARPGDVETPDSGNCVKQVLCTG